MYQSASSSATPKCGTSVCTPYGVNPDRLISLWDMHFLVASELVHIGRIFQALQEHPSLHVLPADYLHPEDQKQVVAQLASIRSACQKMGLVVSTDLLLWMEDQFTRHQQTYNSTKVSVNNASTVFQQELHRLVFLQVEPSRVKYHRDLERFIENPPFSKVALQAFPHAGRDALLAGNCLACGFFDSSAFHCMRVFEIGLSALAHRFNEPFNHETWGRVLDRIESRIRAIDKTFGESFKQDQQRFAEIALEFRFVKDAWRNHVAHGRTEYDFSRAELIYLHTSSFMQRMAEAGFRESA